MRALPLLPTATVGSYSRPRWLRQVMRDQRAGLLSAAEADEAVRAMTALAVADQEAAGVDVISSGEANRPTIVESQSLRLRGFEPEGPPMPVNVFQPEITPRMPLVTGPVDGGDLGLVDEYRLLRSLTAQPIKVTTTGPHSLGRWATNRYYPTDEALVMDIAAVMNEELRRCVAAGMDCVQIDEPSWCRWPDEIDWAVRAFNRAVEGVRATVAVHICFGNLLAQTMYGESYRPIFPRALDCQADQIVLEFARRGLDDLDLFRASPVAVKVGVGVIDVKTHEVETPDTVAERLRAALSVMPAERLWVNPDCGMRYLPREVAFAKLRAMVAGTALVRAEVAGRA